MKKDFDYKQLYQLNTLVESFSDDNEITLYILDKLFQYYLNNADFLIKHSPYSLYVLLDLFGRHSVVFENSIQNNERFIERTYPLLLTKTKYHESSDLAIALYKYFNLLATKDFFPNGVDILRKFLNENKSSPYAAEAIEKLNDVS